VSTLRKVFSAALRIFFTGSWLCWGCSVTVSFQFIKTQVTSQCKILCCRSVTSPLHVRTFVPSCHRFKTFITVEKGLVEHEILLVESDITEGCVYAVRSLHVSFNKHYFNSLWTSVCHRCFLYENKVAFSLTCKPSIDLNKSGCCIRSHSRIGISTYSLLWNLRLPTPKCCFSEAWLVDFPKSWWHYITPLSVGVEFRWAQMFRL
jgi:hypothetical protein